MNEYLLVLKMIASQETHYEDYEFFSGKLQQNGLSTDDRNG